MVQDGQQAIVLTHYAPLLAGSSDAIYTASNSHHGFSTDLSSLLDLNNDIIKLWAFGHSTSSLEKEVHGVLLATYPDTVNNTVCCV